MQKNRTQKEEIKNSYRSTFGEDIQFQLGGDMDQSKATYLITNIKCIWLNISETKIKFPVPPIINWITESDGIIHINLFQLVIHTDENQFIYSS